MARQRVCAGAGAAIHDLATAARLARHRTARIWLVGFGRYLDSQRRRSWCGRNRPNLIHKHRSYLIESALCAAGYPGSTDEGYRRPFQ